MFRRLFSSEKNAVSTSSPSVDTPQPSINWSRVVMNEETQKLVHSLPFSSFSALEISGTAWKDTGFASYTSVQYPAFDICEKKLDEKFKLIIAEQVLEHVLWPYRAIKNIYDMLEPGGYFLVTTPFLLRVHNVPNDCSRWTELGLKHLLAEGGFPLENIVTGSWGNRQCVIENFSGWVAYNPKIHSLHNEPEFPYHVWALARKAER